jgi:DUF218 domain-containing protein
MTGRALVVHGHRPGNAVGGHPWISPECIARVRAAERAARRHGVERVLLSGSGADGFPSEARQMARAWALDDISPTLDEASTDSAENARSALRWAKEIEARELLVVSSWWHLRLLVYYRGRERTPLGVRHVRAWRCDGVVTHILHEIRYFPRAIGATERIRIRP